MRLAVSSYSFMQHLKETRETCQDLCTRVQDMGFGGIEFTGGTLTLQAPDRPEALAEALRTHCDRIGLPIIAYTVGADFLKDADPRPEIERVKGCVDIAARLGAAVLRHDATWTREGSWQEVIARIAPSIREVAAYAAEKNVRTCTENHGYFIQDSPRVKTLMEAVNHPNYGWLVDVGNFACADEDSRSAVETAAPYAVHVHAKDFLYCAGNQPSPPPGEGWFPTRAGHWLRGTMPGRGVIPLAECLGILRRAGYDGWIAYEFEGVEPVLPALQEGREHLRRLLDQLP